MSNAGHNSDAALEGRVRDATDLNWVDRFCPPWSRPYLRLSRADRPIGTWLLLLPCWWAIALGGLHVGWEWRDLWLIIGCAIGAFLMRGAGCTWNDFTDRNFDAQVARTRSRPLPSGQVTPKGALIWMCIQAILAFGILLTFNTTAIVWGIASLVLVCIYPFAKRFTWWPQVFLGLAFNWGALLLWIEKTGTLGVPAVFLYLAGICWTLHYDTIYAHQDKEDDALIGVKSTARLFGENTRKMFWLFTGLVGGFCFLAIVTAGGGWLSMLGLAAFLMHMVWQTITVDFNDTEHCLRIFRANNAAGLLLLAGLMADLVF